MQQKTIAASTKSFSEIMGALSSKVAPKWDAGANPIYDAMEELKQEGVLTRWNSATLKSRAITQGELQRQVYIPIERVRCKQHRASSLLLLAALRPGARRPVFTTERCVLLTWKMRVANL